MKKWLERLGETVQSVIDFLRGKKKPDDPPEDPVLPVEPPEKINKGGDGLYKPESRLHLLPEGIRATDVMEAGEEFVNYYRIGGDAGAFANGKQTPVDDPGFYHNHRLKLRGALASADGVRLFVLGWDGSVIAEMTVKERGVRQEGRTKITAEVKAILERNRAEQARLAEEELRRLMEEPVVNEEGEVS